eukprot:scaffold608190_cov185-Attheya_sp.AAC.1
MTPSVSSNHPMTKSTAQSEPDESLLPKSEPILRKGIFPRAGAGGRFQERSMISSAVHSLLDVLDHDTGGTTSWSTSAITVSSIGEVTGSAMEGSGGCLAVGHSYKQHINYLLGSLLA